MQDSVRRSVSIPIVSDGKNVLAVAEVGAKLWSKDIVYRMFFEHGLIGVEGDIKIEIERRGGNEKDYSNMLGQAVGKLKEAGLVMEVSKKKIKKVKKLPIEKNS